MRGYISVRRHAAEQGIDGADALRQGLEEKSAEFATRLKSTPKHQTQLTLEEDAADPHGLRTLNIFIDSSVAIAASFSATGASRRVFDAAASQNWQLTVSPWVLREVHENLRKGPQAATEWNALRRRLVMESDEFVFEWPLAFAITKDKPILVTALAYADVLLTLDRRDFAVLIESSVYGLRVRTPAGFLREERDAGRVQ